jgi:hypothetical protein
VRRSYLIPFALIAVAAFAQDDQEGEVASPVIVALTVTDGSAAARELEGAVGRLRGTYDEKPVLFLTVNLANKGGKNQAEMLFYSLGLQQIWPECKKAPAQLVLVDLERVSVLAKLGPKDKIADEIDKHIGKEEGCEGGSGGGDGCGCGD